MNENGELMVSAGLDQSLAAMVDAWDQLTPAERCELADAVIAGEREQPFDHQWLQTICCLAAVAILHVGLLWGRQKQSDSDHEGD